MPRLPDPRFAPDCTIEVDGRPVAAREGESVAVALLASGRAVIARSAKYHRARGAFCLAGSCHQCLARVDGLPSRRTCRTPCRDGLVVESQNAVPTAPLDLLAGVDRAYPHGLDHHHLMTWSALANRLTVAASRRLAGLGHMPARAAPIPPPPAEERFEAVVVGAGPAGLAAAGALAQAGRRVLLVEEHGVLGGRLRCALADEGDPPLAWAQDVAAALARAGGEAAALTSAVGLWTDGGSPLLALRADGAAPRLRLVRAQRIIVATGSWALPPVFARNDLPGVFAARGLARALADDGVLAGERIAVSGDGAEAAAFAARLAAAGVAALRVGAVAAGRGSVRLRGLVLASGERVRCDALAHAGPRAPASDLARALGAPVALDPASGGLAVLASGRGTTGVPGLLAAGEVTGAMSAAAAAEAGRRAGEEAARA